MPDPQKPGELITVQKVKLTVESSTACDLFNSCKRVPFVSSVSAMSSPAGFLTFQGHNAVYDGHQYIEIDFSYNKSNSLWFSNDNEDFNRKVLTGCNYTNHTENATLHGFDVNFNVI